MPSEARSEVLPFSNRILRNLPADVVQRLHLRQVDLPTHKAIEWSGDSIENLYFLESGAASMTTIFEDGSEVEVGLFGFESVLGVSALMGTRKSLNRVYMQIGGHGFAAAVRAARAEFSVHSPFQSLVLSSVQAQWSQVVQSVGCNAKHDVGQRLARWLLLCADRAGNRDLSVSQEFLAAMLGVGRISAGLAIEHFKQLGLIEHRRGNIQILNPAGLERRSCECYRAVKQHLSNSSEFESGFAQ